MILVKALPHRSSNYFETVCCAGVGSDHKWRRLYPVPFRVLDGQQKFRRWDWVTYRFTTPSTDSRSESQKVDPQSIFVRKQLNSSERSRLARSLTRESLNDAESRGDTLTLIKPSSIEMKALKKARAALEGERRKHADLANQLSLLNTAAKPLDPCPYAFRFRWVDEEGTAHVHTCDDWETSTTFFKRRKLLGSDDAAIASLKKTFEDDYPRQGVRLALGTHSRRNQWLLVGVLRVDEHPQGELF